MQQSNHQIFLSDDVSALMDSEEIKFWIAVGLYLSEKTSLAKAAKLAGLSRFEFETRISELNIPISLLDEEDLEKELRLIRKSL